MTLPPAAAVSDAEAEAACNAYAQYALDFGLLWGRDDGMHRACMEAALTAHNAARARLGDAGWQPINFELTVYPYEAGIVWLWHRLWDRGPTLGCYDQLSDQWRGVDEGGCWFAVGIPPSHWATVERPLPPSAPVA